VTRTLDFNLGKVALYNSRNYDQGLDISDKVVSRLWIYNSRNYDQGLDIKDVPAAVAISTTVEIMIKD